VEDVRNLKLSMLRFDSKYLIFVNHHHHHDMRLRKTNLRRRRRRRSM